MRSQTVSCIPGGHAGYDLAFRWLKDEFVSKSFRNTIFDVVHKLEDQRLKESDTIMKNKFGQGLSLGVQPDN